MMPAPELDKEQYTPEEVHNLLKEKLGDDTAMQFRMYYNKISKVPPHEIKVRSLGHKDAGSFEYQFNFQNFVDQLGIPQEVLDFITVLSERHGGGASGNMGWVRLHFKDITSPEGNTIKIAIADEIQSDFAQRVSRIRKMFAGALNSPLHYEEEAFRAMKANPELVEEVKVSDTESTFKPTSKLKNAINKIESTTYSDVLGYLFNKAIGFSKQRDAQQMWVPNSEMKAKEWSQYLNDKPEDIKHIFQRVYDDKSVQYGAVQQLEEQIGASEGADKGKHWVINLEDVPEIKLAKRIRLSARWENPKYNMNSDNWKIIFDSYARTFIAHYDKEYDEKMEESPYGGGLGLAESGEEAKMPLLVSAFIDELLPNEAYGDEAFISEFKNHLETKYNYTLDPEIESHLMLGQGWREVTPPEKPVEREKDESAPSVEELEKMFTTEPMEHEKDVTAPSAEELEKLFKFSMKDKGHK